MVLSLPLAIACVSCGSDQKQTASADDASMSQAPSGSALDASMSPASGHVDAEGSSPSSSNAPPSGSTVGTSGSAPPPAAALSQAQIALITELANTAEIEQGKLAEGKAKSPKVKKFASMMVKHHGEAKADQAKLYKELNLTPTQSQEANALKTSADQILGTLRGADGAAFDVAYMNAQVDEHQKVLDAIDRQLLPAATDEKLIEGLKEMRETVASHLKDAKAIQAELNKTAAR
jgi:putative membrane protein